MIGTTGTAYATDPSAAEPRDPDPTLKLNKVQASGDTCGSGDEAINTSIDFGCRGKGNGFADLLFAIIRWLSYGAGLVIVGSVVVAGIQYTTSRGDPGATAAAENRIKSAILALLIFIFAFAILNYIIPGQILNK
jgi:hypothetical protein